MFNLDDIFKTAQGGKGVTHLAQRFGLPAADTQTAVRAMLPLLSLALQGSAQSAHGLGALFSQLGNAVHQQAYANPGFGQIPDAAAQGRQLLDQLFGTHALAEQAQRAAATMSGLSQPMVAQMMPLVASMTLGGLAQTMRNEGLGPFLAPLTRAAGDGAAPFGPFFANPQAAAPARPSPAPHEPFQPFGFALNAWSSMLDAMMAPPKSPSRPPPSLPPGMDLALFRSGMETLTAMFAPGVPVQARDQSAFLDLWSAMSGVRGP